MDIIHHTRLMTIAGRWVVAETGLRGKSTKCSWKLQIDFRATKIHLWDSSIFSGLVSTLNIDYKEMFERRESRVYIYPKIDTYSQGLDSNLSGIAYDSLKFLHIYWERGERSNRVAPNLACCTPTSSSAEPAVQNCANTTESSWSGGTRWSASTLCNKAGNAFLLFGGRRVGLGLNHAVGSDANLPAIYTYYQGQVQT